MGEFEKRQILYGYIKKVCHFSQMQVYATSIYQSNYFQIQIDETVNELLDLMLLPTVKQQEDIQRNSEQQIEQLQAVQREEQQGPPEQIRSFTIEELADNDGAHGRPAYVAVNGDVYDVTEMIRWAGGTHFGVYAGQDLSGPFMDCHLGVIEVLHNVPKIGVLIK